jgi:hypothetical protein
LGLVIAGTSITNVSNDPTSTVSSSTQVISERVVTPTRSQKAPESAPANVNAKTLLPSPAPKVVVGALEQPPTKESQKKIIDYFAVAPEKPAAPKVEAEVKAPEPVAEIKVVEPLVETISNVFDNLLGKIEKSTEVKEEEKKIIDYFAVAPEKPAAPKVEAKVKAPEPVAEIKVVEPSTSMEIKNPEKPAAPKVEAKVKATEPVAEIKVVEPSTSMEIKNLEKPAAPKVEANVKAPEPVAEIKVVEPSMSLKKPELEENISNVFDNLLEKIEKSTEVKEEEKKIIDYFAVAPEKPAAPKVEAKFKAPKPVAEIKVVENPMSMEIKNPELVETISNAFDNLREKADATFAAMPAIPESMLFFGTEVPISAVAILPGAAILAAAVYTGARSEEEDDEDSSRPTRSVSKTFPIGKTFPVGSKSASPVPQAQASSPGKPYLDSVSSSSSTPSGRSNLGSSYLDSVEGSASAPSGRSALGSSYLDSVGSRSASAPVDRSSYTPIVSTGRPAASSSSGRSYLDSVSGSPSAPSGGSALGSSYLDSVGSRSASAPVDRSSYTASTPPPVASTRVPAAFIPAPVARTANSNGASINGAPSVDEWDSIVRVEYNQWLKTYGKTAVENRYLVFKAHVTALEEYGKKTGKYFALNEYADCTEDEYKVSQGANGGAASIRRSEGVMAGSSRLDAVGSTPFPSNGATSIGAPSTTTAAGAKSPFGSYLNAL